MREFDVVLSLVVLSSTLVSKPQKKRKRVVAQNFEVTYHEKTLFEVLK